MKHLLLAFFLIAFTANLSAQTYKIDTIVNETWTSNAWKLSTRLIYTYNSSCQLVTTLSQTRSGSSWVNQVLQTYTYTGDHVSQLLLQNWNAVSSGWDNFSKITYTYDASFRVLTTVTQIWFGAAWQNSSRVTNTYDANGYLATTKLETSLGGILWTNQTLSTFTNNPDGTVSQEIRQDWNLVSMTWDNKFKYIHTYNADKSLHQTVVQQWSGSAWVNSERQTYTYDAQGRLLTELDEVWQNNAWINENLATNTYNGSGQLDNTLDQEWVSGPDTWRNTSKEIFTYNGNGSLFQSVTQVANEGTNYALVNSFRSTFHYTTDCILPLTLLDFTATLSGKDFLLKWTTTKEVNTSYFDIQSSKTAETFSKIGSVKAATNSTQKINYQFVDANPTALASGKIYYRLKMVDRDGKFNYSKIAFVGLAQGENLFSIFPNAVKDNLFLLYYAQNTSRAEVRVIDQSGRQVYRQQLNSVQAGNQVNINVSRLHAGSYYVELVTNEGTRSSKFIKL
jgi:hypothetical protein